MNRTFVSLAGQMAAPMLAKRSILPDFGGRLFAGYVLATAPFASGKLAGSPATDLSGNGRDIVFTGAGPGANWMDGSLTNYATCPFTCRDVWEVGSEISLIGVATAQPTSDFQIVGGRSDVYVDGRQYFNIGFGPGAALDAYNEPTQQEVGATINIPRDPANERDPTRFELLAASWSPRGGVAWRSRVNTGTYNIANFARPGFGGFDDTAPVTIGGIPTVPGASGAGKIALVMIVAGTIENYDAQLYLPLRSLLADLTGIAV